MTREEKDLLIHIGIAIVFLPYALIAWLFWLGSKDKIPRTPAYRRALGTELAVAGILYALYGVMMIGIGAAARAATLPPGTPPQVLSLPDAETGFTSGLIAYNGEPHTFNITFAEKNVDPAVLKDPTWDKPVLNALGGHWAGSNAQLTVDGGRRVEGRATDSQTDWPATIGKSAASPVSPSMSAELPLAKADVHRWLTIRASMDVDLPYQSGPGRYSVATAGVAKTVRFFVVTAAELDLNHQGRLWQDRSFIVADGVIVLVAAGFVAFLGVRKRRRATEGA